MISAMEGSLKSGSQLTVVAVKKYGAVSPGMILYLVLLMRVSLP